MSSVAIDPSENVKALSEASARRQDDLRSLQDRLTDEKVRHLNEIVQLQAEHAREVREIETARLNAIRQVDVLARTTEAERALTAIQTLATTNAANAENLRASLTATAATIAKQQEGYAAGINERLLALERSSYEGKGKGVGIGQIGAFVAGAVGVVGVLVSIAVALFVALR